MKTESKNLFSIITRKAHSMHATAQRRSLKSPSVNLLKQLIWWTLTNPSCKCGKSMVLSSRFGPMTDVISMHHDPDGSIMFICQSCNSKIKNRSAQSFFTPGVKECSKCSKTLLISEFYNNKSKPDRLSTYCKSCTRSYEPSFKGCRNTKKPLQLDVEVGRIQPNFFLPLTPIHSHSFPTNKTTARQCKTLN